MLNKILPLKYYIIINNTTLTVINQPRSSLSIERINVSMYGSIEAS